MVVIASQCTEYHQPLFTHHRACIIGFSHASKHIVVAPERVTWVHINLVMFLDTLPHTHSVAPVEHTLVCCACVAAAKRKG